MEQKKKYAKTFTKISHLTDEQKKERLREQKRKWAQKYVKSQKYKEKNADVLHKKMYKKVMSEIIERQEINTKLHAFIHSFGVPRRVYIEKRLKQLIHMGEVGVL